MAFQARIAEEILTELQKWTKTAESKVEGTFEYDCFATNALEFMKVEEELAAAYRANFAQSAAGEYLTLRAAEHGVLRRPANKAIGELTVTGNGEIPAGSVFSTTDGVRFVSTGYVRFEDEVNIKIEALKAGASGNVAAGTITNVPLSIPGITGCSNSLATYDGYDEEDDEALRARLLAKVRLPATSGNPHQYVQWAMSVVGVGAARCVRCPYGPGTVKIVVVDSNFQPANNELITRIKTFISQERPVGILDGEVYVVSAQPYTIDIAADIIGTVDVNSFRAGLQDYFTSLIAENLNDYQNAFDGGIVSVAQIGKIIIVDGGAINYVYGSLNVNGANIDIPLDAEQLPIIGTINFY